MAVEHVDDELWNEFHRVVNMTSHELRDWLLTRSVDEDGAVEPGTQGGVGTPTGQEVLRILGKRRTDLTSEDERVMRNVVAAGHRAAPRRPRADGGRGALAVPADVDGARPAQAGRVSAVSRSAAGS